MPFNLNRKYSRLGCLSCEVQSPNAFALLEEGTFVSISAGALVSVRLAGATFTIGTLVIGVLVVDVVEGVLLAIVDEVVLVCNVKGVLLAGMTLS